MYNLTNQTKIFGIIGYPLSHTLSPDIHNFLFGKYGFNGIYLVFETDNPEKTFIALQNINIAGLSVTIPYKEWAYSISGIKDDTSELMKASNTLTFDKGNIIANNTDGYGAIEAIKNSRKGIFNSSVLILGSGGSARGISFSILKELDQKRKIYISARNELKALELVDLLNSIRPWSTEYIPLGKVNEIQSVVSLIINTTPLGMKNQSQEILLSEKFFTKKHTLFDIVYNPSFTPLVKLAKKNNSKIIYGHEMLVYQAMKQFEIFTSIKVEKKIIEIIKKRISNKLK